mgnify:CR=1 FL=1
MAYRIEGLDPALARAPGARAVTADAKPGFPCRATLGRPEIAFINAHNAAAGCFAARIVRD